MNEWMNTSLTAVSTSVDDIGDEIKHVGSKM